jgi:hypothetical protein
MLVVGPAASLVIWRVSMESQSQYTVAKALVIASPLLLILAVLPLIEMLPARYPRLPFNVPPRRILGTCLAVVLLALLVFGVGSSDVRALRYTPVGPEAHGNELRELAPLLEGRRTLFLADDDLVKFEMTPQRVLSPLYNTKYEVPTRPAKHWAYGEALDFDSVTAATLNSFAYVVTTRDSAGSQPPTQMKLVKSTPNYRLWRRVGKVQERSVLGEGEASGAVLECESKRGKKILAAGGVAAVRPAPVVVEAPPLGPGGSVTIEMPLGKGEWSLVSSYNSRLPIKVTGSGLDTTLDANLDRVGPRWPIGKVTASGEGPVDLTFEAQDTWLAPYIAVAVPGKITATRIAPERVVPIHQACGKYVDWYRSGGSTR